MTRGTCDARHADGGSLPEIEIVDLGDRNIEFVLNCGRHRSQYAPLVFQGPACRNEYLEAPDADEHRAALPCDLLDLESLNHVPFLDVLEAFEGHSTFVSLGHLSNVVLETLE